MTKAAAAIRLQKHYVTDGTTKARVFYSRGQICRAGEILDCVTLYAKDFSDNLMTIFGSRYENDTEIQTDYFDKGRVRIFPGDPLFDAAAARAARPAA